MKIVRYLEIPLTIFALVPWSVVGVLAVDRAPGTTIEPADSLHTLEVVARGPGASIMEPGSSIVIDHTAVDAAAIPQSWLDEARGLATLFNHKSIGENILDGVADLESLDPDRYAIDVQYSNGTAAGINEYQAGSNGSPLTKVDGFAPLVKDGHDAAFMKFCTGDAPCVAGDTPMDDVWTAYRDMMVAEQAAHPSTPLIWWTWPIIASDNSRASCNEELQQFNDTVRAYVAANGGVLFDIADIESHDQNGDPVNYNGWEAAYPGYTTDGAHLSETGRQRVASALWWLLASVAGWGGGTEWISITPDVGSVYVYAGETASYSLSVTASEGFTDTVSLSLQGAPSESEVVFDVNPVTPPGSSQLHVTTTISAAFGTYPMSVTGSSSDLSAVADLTLNVRPFLPYSVYLPTILK
ncbi:MAG: hypothetical protein PVH50_08365 [Anaerolineae bacterium]